MKSSIVCLLWSAFAVLLTAAVIMMYEDANHFIRWSTTATTTTMPPPLKSAEKSLGGKSLLHSVDDLNKTSSSTTVGNEVNRSTPSSLTDARKVSDGSDGDGKNASSSSAKRDTTTTSSMSSNGTNKTIDDIRDSVMESYSSVVVENNASASGNGGVLAPKTATTSLLGGRNYAEHAAPLSIQSTGSTATKLSQLDKAFPSSSPVESSSDSISEGSAVSPNNSVSFVGQTPPRVTSLMDGNAEDVLPESVKSADDGSISPNNGLTIPSRMDTNNAKGVAQSVNSPPSSQESSTAVVPRNGSNGTVAIVPPPPLSSLVRGKSVIGDVSGLLDFAIVGFPKSGTSSLLEWLEAHPDVQMAPGEYMELYAVGRDDGLSNFVRYFHQRYLERPSCSSCKRGYKNPRELYEYGGMQKIERYFYKTNIVVALRHPITWFQSFHNYRTSSDGDGWNGWGCPVEERELLTMNCTRGVDLCVEHTKFHSYLYRLGKTRGLPEERELMIHDSILPRRPFSTGKVFVFEVSQLSDPGTTLDISNFLGLEHPLVPGPKNNVGFAHAFDICQDRYDRLRERLLGIAVNASLWIRNCFLQSPDVVVSPSRERFEELLLDWKEDPCQKKKKQNQ